MSGLIHILGSTHLRHLGNGLTKLRWKRLRSIKASLSFPRKAVEHIKQPKLMVGLKIIRGWLKKVREVLDFY